MSVEANPDQQAEFVEVLDAEPDEKVSQATALVDFVLARAELFHDANGDTYARIRLGGEIRRLDSRGFRDWMLAGFFSTERKSARDQSVREAIATLSGIARYQGEQREVYIRVAHHDSAYWIDLGIPGDSRAVRVTAGSWEVVGNPPVAFVRPESLRPLPVPAAGGDINTLFQYANVPPDHRLLVIAVLIDSLRPNTPYPNLELLGEAGSAKSMTARFLRRLIDPNGCELRAMPRSVEDIYVAAAGSHVIALENISHLPPAMQDCLCLLATGGGYARRKLYTDADESVIVVKRPVTINGISASVTAQDLVDRTISVELPLIAERVEADVLLERFDGDHPVLLGALLDLFAAALARLPQVHIPADQRPRLLEYAKLGCAVAEVMGRTAQAFMSEFTASRQDSIHRTLDASPAASALVEWFEGQREVVMSPKEILDALDRLRPVGVEGWPRSPKGMGDVLRRAAPALRQIGIDCRPLGKTGGRGRWRIRRKDMVTSKTSTEPVSSEEMVL